MRANGCRGRRTPSPTSPRSATTAASARSALTVVDRALEGRQWLVGETCSIADLGCWGRMVFMAEGGFDIQRWPNIVAWRDRLTAMPGFALPYDLIPKKDTEFDPA